MCFYWKRLSVKDWSECKDPNILVMHARVLSVIAVFSVSSWVAMQGNSSLRTFNPLNRCDITLHKEWIVFSLKNCESYFS